MPIISYRKCRIKDLVPARRLILRTLNALITSTGKEPLDWVIRREPPALMVSMLKNNPNGFYCAWKGEKLIGFAGSYLNGKQWYLGWLFVDHRVQAKGVGRKLLEKVWIEGKGITHSLTTMAYNPQAVGLYSKFGMAPSCDLPMMHLKKSNFSELEPTGLTIVEDYTKADTNWINQTEKKIRGYAHPRHWDVWLSDYPFKLYIAKNRGQRVGYFLITDQGFITPLGVSSPKYMNDVLTEAVRKAMAVDGKGVFVWCPTFNISSYLYLIQLGFRILEMEIFMSDEPYPDWQRYIPSNLAIF